MLTPLHLIENVTGYEIMKCVEKNTRSNSSYQLNKFEIIRKNNNRYKEFEFFRKNNSENKTLLKITNPLKDKSIALLTISSTIGKSNQWLFLPELNKVKPILNENKGQAFLGSDFYYEDFEENSIDSNSYDIIGKENNDKRFFYVIRAKPIDKNSSTYSEKKFWIDSTNFTITKTEFYQNGKLLKTLYSDVITKDSNIYTVMKSTMILDDNPENKSILTVISIKHNVNLNDYIFTVQNLSRR
jgi:hypothetical protein